MSARTKKFEEQLNGNYIEKCRSRSLRIGRRTANVSGIDWRLIVPTKLPSPRNGQPLDHHSREGFRMQYEQVKPAHDAGALRPASEIARELDKIAVELRNPVPDDRWTQLYAAQQALSWVVGTGAPAYGTIMNGKVQPLVRDIPADSEDCSAAPHRLPS